MNWYHQTLAHEKKIRRQAFWTGLGYGITIMAIGSMLLDYVIGILRQ